MLSNLVNLKTSRKLILAFALLASIISWTDGLEAPSDHYLTESLKSGAAVWVIARGINATVSVIKGTEITPPFMTLAVGEVLDPIDDLIERFSGLLMLALGSLALQKILLVIFGHYGFSVLITALFALLTVSASFARFGAWFNTLLKLFCITVALHFSMAAAIIANSVIDKVFLQEADDEHIAGMVELNEELMTLSNARADAPTEEEVAAATAQLDALRGLETRQQQDIDELRSQLDALSTELDGMRSEVSMVCRLNPLCDEGDGINAKKLEVQTKQAELSAAESANESTAAEIKEQREYLECAAKQQAGQACTFWGRTQSLVSPSEWKKRFNIAGDRMKEYANNAVKLIALWIAKTIVIPLLFLYLLVQGYKLAFRNLFAENTA